MHLTSLMRYRFEGIGIQLTMLAGILPIAVLNKWKYVRLWYYYLNISTPTWLHQHKSFSKG